MRRGRTGLLAALTLALTLLIAVGTACGEEPRSLRVAMIDFPNYLTLDEQGQPVGMAVEFLNALSRYTGWTYEYVPMSMAEAGRRLADGGVDLLPGAHQALAQEDTPYAFAEKSMGAAGRQLVCREDDDRFAFEDYPSFAGMRVGLLHGSAFKEDEDRVAGRVGQPLTFVPFETHEACREALLSGEVDALMLTSIRVEKGMKTIARFGSTDLYMACTPTRPELLEQLNTAQEALFSANPYCLLHLWEKYYDGTTVAPALTREELAYIGDQPPVRVGLLTTLPTIAGVNGEGEITGITAELFRLMAQKTGVTVTLLGAPSMAALREGLENGEYDVIAPVRATGLSLLEERSDRMTAPLFDSSLVLVGRRNCLSETGDLPAALCSDDPLLLSLLADSEYRDDPVMCATADEALAAVLDGRACPAIMDSASAHWLMDRPMYDDLNVFPVPFAQVSMCAEVSPKADARLLPLLNKAIASVSSDELEQIILQETVGSPYRMTLTDIATRFRVPLILSLVLVLLVMISLVSVIIGHRRHERRMARSREELNQALRVKQEEEARRRQLEIQHEADERYQRVLSYQANHDELTGLYNKNGFIAATRRVLDQSPDVPYVLLRGDITQFKLYNDLFGLEAGDQMLRLIAGEMTRLARPGMTYGRWSADHFVCCVPASMAPLEKLSDHMTAWLRRQCPNYELQPCIGVYEIDDPTIDINLMCDRAQLAMRTVKGLYPAKIGFYSDRLRERIVKEQWVISTMQSALEAGQFVPYFQPQYHLHTGEISGAELLVRWNSPEKGLMAPNDFIPIFERSGAVAGVDAYIWEQACRWLRSWLDRGNPALPVSVNVSRVDMRLLDVCHVIPALVEKYNLSPSLIRLEVTESAYVDSAEQLIRIIHRMQEMGFIIEMDDFGSGYSSLNLLKDVPVNVLKLDMRFLSPGDAYGRSASILRSIMNMARWLRLQVIAEGVETKQQIDFLRSIGCSFVQGYYFAKPLPEDEFERVLHASRIGRLSTSGYQMDNGGALLTTPLTRSGRKTLILADMDQPVRSQLRSVLGTEYDYLEVVSGRALMEQLHAGVRPSAILVDARLPDMNGYEVVQAVRADPQLSNIPVMLMMDERERNGGHDARAAGASDYIFKPLHADIVRYQVTNLLRLYTALRNARYDSLTGLYNRTTLLRRIADYLQAMEGSPVRALLMALDVDGFKQLNDAEGRLFGDQTLVALAKTLRKACGSQAIIGRMGGDDFIILAPNMNSRAQMRTLGARILEKARMIEVDGRKSEVSCSIGAAIYPGDFAHQNDLYAAADAALCEAKRLGGNNLCFYDECFNRNGDRLKEEETE